MRLVTFRAHPAAAGRLGALADGYVIDLALLGQAGGVALPDDMLSFIDLGPAALAQAARNSVAPGPWAPRCRRRTSSCWRPSRARARTSSASA